MDQYFVSAGPHKTREDGMCAMEWVAYLAGEVHSDVPECVCLELRQFCVCLNDRLSRSDRQKLRPYLARTIGTRGDGLSAARREICREWTGRFMPRSYLFHYEADEAFQLLDAMLPTEPIQLPVAADAEAVCALA